MGVYNKFRALDSPPACGPNLVTSAMRATFSLEGRRVLPHWGEKLGRCRLMVEHADRVLFVRDDDRRVLPGGPLTGQKTGMDLGNLIGPLDCMVVEQSGLKVPWIHPQIQDWAPTLASCSFVQG